MFRKDASTLRSLTIVVINSITPQNIVINKKL